MKLRISLGTAFVAALALSLGCGEEDSQKVDTGTVAGAEVSPKVDTSPATGEEDLPKADTGTLAGSVYHNEHFGFRVTFPAGWSVQDQAARQQIADTGAKLFAGDDPQIKAKLEATKQDFTSLFGVFEHPPGTPVPFNANITGVAQNLRLAPSIESGADFLSLAKRAADVGQVETSVQEELKTETIGGRSFDLLIMDMHVRELTVHQKVYAMVVDGHVLAITLSYTTSEQEAALDKILSTLRFD